jgi:hypothetical protein
MQMIARPVMHGYTLLIREKKHPELAPRVL